MKTRQLNVKTRLKAPPIACIPTIFELSAPKLTKSTRSRKFPRRGTLPPLSAWSTLLGVYNSHLIRFSLARPIEGCSWQGIILDIFRAHFLFFFNPLALARVFKKTRHRFCILNRLIFNGFFLISDFTFHVGKDYQEENKVWRFAKLALDTPIPRMQCAHREKGERRISKQNICNHDSASFFDSCSKGARAPCMKEFIGEKCISDLKVYFFTANLPLKY